MTYAEKATTQEWDETEKQNKKIKTQRTSVLQSNKIRVHELSSVSNAVKLLSSVLYTEQHIAAVENFNKM